jgi:hypothetical protein
VAAESVIDEDFYKKSDREEKIHGCDPVKREKGQRTGPS